VGTAADVLQTAFGWTDSHLHGFEVNVGDRIPGVPFHAGASSSPNLHHLHSCMTCMFEVGLLS
jgi:hypothetical protein